MKFLNLLCWSLLFLLTSAKEFQILESISDFKEVWYGHMYPRHGLHFLYWFVDNTVIDSDNTMRPQFDPTRGDYGFGHLNVTLLPDLIRPKRQAYYIAGDLEEANSRALPDYVTQSHYNSLLSGDRNRDRVAVRVVRAEGSDQFRLDEVYITQLYPLNNKEDSIYDQDHTYGLSFNLLKEIKTLQQNTSGPGLDRFLKQAGYESCSPPEYQTCSQRFISFQRLRMTEIKNGSDCGPLRLRVQATDSGYAKMSWSNVPDAIVHHDVVVALFQEEFSQTKLDEAPIGTTPSGTYDTSVVMNSALQVRLLKQNSAWRRDIWRGAELHDANRVIPIAITDYPANLQLYTRDGYAGARLLLKKSFTGWREEFQNSWVGFYSADSVDTSSYSTWQWVVSFQDTIPSDNIPEFVIYEYVSSMAIAPGAQARFILSNTYEEIIRTIPWEG